MFDIALFYKLIIFIFSLQIIVNLIYDQWPEYSLQGRAGTILQIGTPRTAHRFPHAENGKGAEP